MARDDRPGEIRVWEKVAMPDRYEDCWRWTGRLQSDGYGCFDANKKTVLAHRFIYELVIDSIPEGMQIDHLCRNRWCVNPYHMEPVTPRENTMRGISFSAQNARKTHCPQGHPYDEANTYIIPSNGARTCRACIAARKQKAVTSREEMTA